MAPLAALLAGGAGAGGAGAGGAGAGGAEQPVAGAEGAGAGGAGAGGGGGVEIAPELLLSATPGGAVTLLGSWPALMAAF